MEAFKIAAAGAIIDKHGPGTALTDLLSLLSADCPRAVAAQLRDWCGAQFTAGHRQPVLVGNLTVDMRAALQQREPLLMRERPFVGRVVEADITELEQIIFTTPARTMAGVRAKARARVMAYMIEAMDLTPTGEQSASLITDIFALGSAA